MSGNFVHCKRERQRIVYIYNMHKVVYKVGYIIYVNNTLPLALAVHEISRHFWAAYSLFTSHNTLVTTRQSSNAFAWLVTACSRYASRNLLTDLLQVDCQNLLSTGLLQVLSTSCDKSAKFQQSFDFYKFVTTYNFLPVQL